MPEIREMIGKTVEVLANGTRYRGILIEVTDLEVQLKTSMQWLSIPVASVSSIRLEGQNRRETERYGIFSS